MKKHEDWVKDMIEIQLKMVGKTLQEARTNPNWYHENTFTPEQYQEFKKTFIDICRNKYKVGVKAANNRFSWFDLQYGLRVENNESIKTEN
jgi:hypothetical protein